MGFANKDAEQFLADTGRRCCICGMLHDVSLHHIVPREDGGGDDIDNAISLCPNCHNVVHGHSTHASGTTTRKYTATELRRHRQRTILQVSGKLPETVKTWSLPHLRNPHFTGREEILEDLDGVLQSGQAAAVTQAITGLGGVGKTQLATEYAYRHADRYEVVWWMRAEESATLKGDYAGLAGELDLPESGEADLRVVCGAVRRYLEQRGGWLLVFDNAEKPEDLTEYIPRGGEGHIIVTSRNWNWGSIAGELAIKEFTRDESVDFLIERTGEEDRDAADKLADALGDLPLALAQAAAYITEKHRSMAEYLELFEKRRGELLKRGKAFVGYSDTVATTWEMSFQALEAECALAADLLNLCAFLAPDDIPLHTIRKHSETLPERLAGALEDELELDDTLAALGRYSLADVSKGLMSVHRLVQVVMRDRLGEDERKAWAEAAVRLMENAFPFDLYEVDTWEPSVVLMPHAQSAAEHAEEMEVALEITGRLLNEVGLSLHNRAAFAGARETYERVLAIGEKAYGEEHPNVATIVNNLGSVLQDMGDLAGARKAFKRALAIDEKVCGETHPDVTAIVNNLGSVLQDMGDLDGAREAYERALAIDEKVYGAEHPTVAIRVNNLGSVLQVLGDLDGAREAFERALAIDEEIYGKEHPEVATDVNNLGSVLYDSGDLEGAKEALERAIGILVKFLPPDHPNIVTSQKNLAIVEKQLEEQRRGE